MKHLLGGIFMNRQKREKFSQFDPLSPRDAWKFSGKPFKWIYAITRQCRLEVFLALILILATSLLGIVPAYYTGKMIDEIFIAGDMSNFWTYAIIIFAVPVLRGVVMMLRRLLYEYVSQYTFIRVRDALYQHLQKLDQDFYSVTPTGRIMARLTGDLDMIRHFTAWSGFMTIQTMFTFIVGAIYLFSVDSRLAGAVIMVSPLLLFFSVKLLKKIKPVWENIRQQFEKLNAVVQQNINGNRTTRAFVRHEYEIDKFEVENTAFAKLGMDGAVVRANTIPFIDGLSSFMYIPVILLGGIFVIKNMMSMGDLVIFDNSLYMIIEPMRMLGFLIDDFQHYGSSAEKIIEIMMTKTKVASPAESDITENPEEVDRSLVKASVESPYFAEVSSQRKIDVEKEISIINDPNAKREDKLLSRSILTEDYSALKTAEDDTTKVINGYIPDKPFPLAVYSTRATLKTAKIKVDDLVANYVEAHPANRIRLKGDVVFDDVSFDYTLHGQKVPALRNISFRVFPGQTIGIIGETGSGKTTLVELISRLADPTEGRILLDGRDLRTYPLEAVRRSIHPVTQDVFLFSDTVESNIAFSDPLMDTEEVYRAAKIAAADGFIRKMEDGYDTIIGEEGVGLSGGQRQRISLARAVAGDPDILILDDTTSAVDMNTDALIRRNLKESLEGKTVFIIAQRISSIRNADQIFVLQEGRIVEKGTHDYLLSLNGIYTDIYETQVGDSKEALESLLAKLNEEGEKNGK